MPSCSSSSVILVLDDRAADVANLLDVRARSPQALDVASVVRGDLGKVLCPKLGREIEQGENLFERSWAIFAGSRSVMINERDVIAGELFR